MQPSSLGATPADKPWPTVKWDYSELLNVALVCRIINPHVTYPCDESCASYIRSVSERSLYRACACDDALSGYMVSTGSWIVTFTYNSKGGYNAHPAITGYSAKCFLGELNKLGAPK